MYNIKFLLILLSQILSSTFTASNNNKIIKLELRKCCPIQQSTTFITTPNNNNNNNNININIKCINNINTNYNNWIPKLVHTTNPTTQFVSNVSSSSSSSSVSFRFIKFSLPKCSSSSNSSLINLVGQRFSPQSVNEKSKSPKRRRRRFIILKDGELILKYNKEEEEGDWILINSKYYCMDELLLNGRNKEEEFLIVTCKDSFETQVNKAKENGRLGSFKFAIAYITAQQYNPILGVAYIISISFLALVLIAYCVTWANQNYHGWIQTSFVISIILNFLAETIRNVVRFEWLLRTPYQLCYIYCLALSFTRVSASTNIVVMCFDLFWTIWKSATTAEVGHSSHKRFWLSLTLAWAPPILYSTIEGVKYLNNKLSHDDLLQLSHWVESAKGVLFCYGFPDLYVHCSILSLNCVLFITILGLIVKRKWEYASCLENVSKWTQLKIWVIISIKLFFIMGLWWPRALLSTWQDTITAGSVADAMRQHSWKFSLLGSSKDNNNNNPSSSLFIDYKNESYWSTYIIHCIFALAGLPIFVIFVCTGKTARGLQKRFKGLKFSSIITSGENK